jgi:hypothetical protein
MVEMTAQGYLKGGECPVGCYSRQKQSVNTGWARMNKCCDVENLDNQWSGVEVPFQAALTRLHLSMMPKDYASIEHNG